MNQTGATIEESCPSDIDYVDGWEEVSPNVWFHDFGVNYWNPAEYVAIGDRDNPAIRSKNPSAQGEYETVSGGSGVNSSITMYSEGEPEVWVGMGQRPLLLLSDCHDCTVVMEGRYGSVGVKLDGCSGIEIIRADIDNVYRGVVVKNSHNNHLHDVKGRNYSCLGVIVRGNNNLVESCDFQHVGYSESIAGIYMDAGADNNHVRKNKIADVKFGIYHDVDGHGVMTETGSTNNRIEYNSVFNCFRAYHDNSQALGNRFFYNRAYDCGEAMQISQYLESGTQFACNLLVNTPMSGTLAMDDPTRVFGNTLIFN